MPKTLVFLAASPADQARLRVDIEEREIKDELQRSKLRDEFVTIYQPALRFDDLLHVLREQKPYIVHFSGHGEGGMGLVLEDEQGKAKFLDNEVLTKIFEQLKGHTQGVVLNACYSEVQVLAIAQHVPYVVGMNARVPDRVAVEFARQFYAGLGAGETLEQAFHWAKVALLGMDQSGAQIPVLYKDGKPLETHESKVLAPKQRSFVERIFSDYVELSRPVLILAQEGFQTQHYIQALKDKANTRFKVLHVFPPASDQVSEAEYFAYLARQCGLGEGISNSTKWYLALSERLMQGQELLLLITGFENGAEQYRRSFAGEVRNLLGAFPHDLHLIMFGGERLAAMRFGEGVLSLLNFIDYEVLPELCIEDVKKLYQVSGLSDEALLAILKFAGQHPRLVQLCLREAVNGGAWAEAVRYSSLPSSLFSRVRSYEHLCEYLGEKDFRLDIWAGDAVERSLYWQNLLKPEKGRLVWRCEWLREVGRELMRC